MKKLLLIFLLCFCMAGCCSDKRANEISTISFEEFEDRLQEKESFILIIGRDDCANCVALSEMLKSTDKELKDNILYLKYTSEERNEFLEKAEHYFENISLIPYFAVIQEGNVEKTGQGYSTETDFWDFYNR